MATPSRHPDHVTLYLAARSARAEAMASILARAAAALRRQFRPAAQTGRATPKLG